ncbi:hypothetical protein GN956_G5215 [Arapaima gigas]
MFQLSLQLHLNPDSASTAAPETRSSSHSSVMKTTSSKLPKEGRHPDWGCRSTGTVTPPRGFYPLSCGSDAVLVTASVTSFKTLTPPQASPRTDVTAAADPTRHHRGIGSGVELSLGWHRCRTGVLRVRSPRRHGGGETTDLPEAARSVSPPSEDADKV